MIIDVLMQTAIKSESCVLAGDAGQCVAKTITKERLES